MKRKKLSLHVNREVAAAHTDCHPVVHTLDPPSGLHELKVRDSEGNRIGFFQISASEMDDELLEALHDWQGRHSHPIPRMVKS